MTARHLPAAIEQEKRNTSWADRTLLNRGDHDQRAMATARNRALMEYQEKHGFNKQPEVQQGFAQSRADLDAAAKGSASNIVAPLLSIGRVGVGIPQGLAGLYDLATPGTGTNRVSQALDAKAKEIDTLAADMDINTAYKAGNIGGEFLSYMIPGTLAAKVGSRAAKIFPKGTKLSVEVVESLARRMDSAGDANKVRMFLANRMRQNFTVDEAIEEMLITGRYMGQNTGRGGDTSITSVATDVGAGVGGGLLFPTKGIKNLFNSPEQGADEAAGAALSTLSQSADNIKLPTKAADEITVPEIPTVQEPEAPKPNEVAPGVIKSGPVVPDVPTAPITPPVTTPPVVTPPTVDVPPAPESPTLYQPGTGPVAQTGTPIAVPQRPQAIHPELQKQLDEAAAGVDESTVAPVPEAATPVANEVVTPNEVASEAAAARAIPAQVAPAQTADEIVGSLKAQRQAMADAGVDTATIDNLIAKLETELNGQAAQTVDEIPTPVKPAPPQEGVRNVEVSADELRARGVSEEGIAREMARQAEAKGAVPEPEEPRLKTQADKDAHEAARSEAVRRAEAETEANAKIEQERLTTKVLAEQTNGYEGGMAGQKVTMTESTGADGQKLYAVTNNRGAGSGAPETKTYRTEAGAQKAYDKQASSYKDQADMKERKAGGKGSRPVKTVAEEEGTTPVTAPVKKKKEPATVAPVVTTEAPSKPKAPTTAELQAGARANTTKSGKVSEKWIKEQRKAGANDVELVKAIQKVEGKKAPKTEEQKFEDEAVKTARETAKKQKGQKQKGQVKAAPGVSERSAQAAGNATDSARIKSAYATFGASRDKVSFGKSLNESQTRVKDMDDKTFLTEVDSLVNPKAADGTTKPQTDYDADLYSAKERLTRMLSDAFKKKDTTMLEKIDTAYSKIVNLETSAAASRGEGLGFQGYLTHIDSPALAANHFRSKLQKMVKAGGGDPEKAVSDAEFVKYFDAKQAVSDTNTTLLSARGTADDLSARLKAGGDDKPTRAEMEKVWKEIEDTERTILEKSDDVDDVIREIRERLDGEGLLGKEGSKVDWYEAHVKGAMLSGLTGRTRDTAVTKLLNQTNASIENAIKTAMGKVLSGVSGKQVGTSGSFGSSKVAQAKGWKNTRQKIADDWMGRSPAGYLGDPAKSGGRSEIPVNPSKRQRNLFLRTVHTATAIPTHLTESTRTKRLFQAGMADAKAAGLQGDDAKLFADNYVFNAPPEVKKMADQEMLAMSGMQNNPVTNTFIKAEEGLRRKANALPPGKKRDAARLAVSQAVLLAAPFKKFMGGSIHYALNKNAVTQTYKLLTSDAPKYLAAKKAGDTAAMAKHLDDGLKHVAAGGWDVAKVGAASMAILPHLSDTDAEGNSYSPPYLKVPGTETYIPMSSFGFASTPILHAWALRKGIEGIKEEGPIAGMIRYNKTLMTGIVKSTGLDNVITGDNGIGRLLSAFGGGEQQASGEAGEPENQVAKTASRFGQDIATQWTPALGRDLNSLINWMTGEQSAPETKVYDANGKRDWARSSLRTVASGVPGWSQSLPRSDTKKAQSVWDRFLGSNTSSETYLNDKKQTDDKMSATTKSLTDSGAFNNPDLKALLGDDDEKMRLYDKLAKGETEGVQQTKIDALITDMTSTDAQKKFIEDGKYQSYKASKTLELEKMNRDPNSSETEKGKVKRDITRADLADTNKIDKQIYALYTGKSGEEGAGISQTELNKMLNKEDHPDLYDPETAFALITLDELFTKNGVSGNTDGMNPWTKNKYVKPKDGWGGSGSGSGGDKLKMGTDLANALASSASLNLPSQKYQKLVNRENPIPNLTTATARTNLKKKISVAKGVQL